jgi:predicted  nucleic acid-binding Zn-ribbon protein
MINELRQAAADVAAVVIDPRIRAKELDRQQRADNEAGAVRYHATEEARRTESDVEYAHWKAAADQKLVELADPDGRLRQTEEATGTAWRAALENQIKLTADLETVNRQRPTAEKAIVAWLSKKHTLMNDLDELAQQLPELEAAALAAQAAVNVAYLAAAREQERATSQALHDLNEAQKLALRTAEIEASRWAGMRKKIESGQG